MQRGYTLVTQAEAEEEIAPVSAKLNGVAGPPKQRFVMFASGIGGGLIALILLILMIMIMSNYFGAKPGNGQDCALNITLPGAPRAVVPSTVSASDYEAVAKALATFQGVRSERYAACDDFYMHVCADWRDRNPTPEGQTHWDSHQKLAVENRNLLKAILEQDWPVIGTMYKNCKDELVVREAGTAPVQPLLDSVDEAFKPSLNPAKLATALAALHRLGVPALWRVKSMPDGVDRQIMRLNILQGGFSMPDPAFYADAGKKTDFQDYVKNLLNEFREPNATLSAEAIVRFESEQAQNAAPFAALMRQHEDLSVAQLTQLTNDSFDWSGYLDALGVSAAAKQRGVVVRPASLFLQRLANVVLNGSSAGLDTLRLVLRFQVMHSFAESLSDRPYNDYKDFLRLIGVTQRQSRDDWCVDVVNDHLGDILGKYFVHARFTRATQTKAEALVLDVADAFAAMLRRVQWMDGPTREAAGKKLAAMNVKLGNPVPWTDYSSLPVVPNDFANNVMSSRRWTFDRMVRSLDYATNRNKWWHAKAQDVRVKYHPWINDVVVPAGSLQAPFFDASFPNAVNYGAMAAMLASDMMNGFDGWGRNFDSAGARQAWWSRESVDAYNKKAQCLVDEYNSYVWDQVLPGVHVNGTRTLAQNAADLAGVKLAYAAFKSAEQRRQDTIGSQVEVADAVQSELQRRLHLTTSDQLFFLSYARSLCSNVNYGEMRQQLSTGRRAPAPFRVRGVLSNLPEFAAAFQCPLDSPMNPSVKCDLW